MQAWSLKTPPQATCLVLGTQAGASKRARQLVLAPSTWAGRSRGTFTWGNPSSPRGSLAIAIPISLKFPAHSSLLSLSALRPWAPGRSWVRTEGQGTEGQAKNPVELQSLPLRCLMGSPWHTEFLCTVKTYIGFKKKKRVTPNTLCAPGCDPPCDPWPSMVFRLF